jgi:hypothetical protein
MVVWSVSVKLRQVPQRQCCAGTVIAESLKYDSMEVTPKKR